MTFYTYPEGPPVRWRESGEIPPTALFVGSPYDLDARYAKKRTTRWTGYKVHLTETCDDERPNPHHGGRDHGRLGLRRRRDRLDPRVVGGTGPPTGEARRRHGLRERSAPRRGQGELRPRPHRSDPWRQPVATQGGSGLRRSRLRVSTGTASGPRVRRGRSARAGRRPSTAGRTRSSRSSLPRPTAASAPVRRGAPGRRHRDARSPSGTAPSTRRSRQGGHESGRPSSPPSTRVGPAWRGRSRRGRARTGSGGRGTSGWPRHTSST